MLAFTEQASFSRARPCPSAVAAVFRIAALVAFYISTPVAASPPSGFPYIPTTILIPGSAGVLAQNSSDVAYIFSPAGESVNLLALNISTTIEASSVGLQTLTSGLPFLDGTSSTSAFTPSILDNGTIAVYAGDCSSESNFATWTYTPAITSTDVAGAWSQYGTVVGSSLGLARPGPSFLGQSLSFSSTLAPTISPAEVYVYGGMCPSANSTTSMWQWSATYSNQMLRLTPSQQSTGTVYTLDLVASNGPPIPEAGFTFTSLSLSISNRSGTVTQQVDSVLLGGNTQDAFINISTAAIWSLPEETWSFVAVNPPTPDTNTELAKKISNGKRSLPTSVSSRSGHTAVLSEDGNLLVILGGWVGDISQAASPQLAILEINADYDAWQWSIPSAQPSGPGIYGHGAALLPGNTMMVYGGYNISSPAQSSKRAASGASSPPMFLNLTSMSWSSGYTNPSYVARAGSGRASGGNSHPPKNKQIGLGVGLGVGIPLLFALVVLCYCCRRKVAEKKRHRDEAVLSLAQDANQFLQNDDEMMERDGGGGFFSRAAGYGSGWYTGGQDPYDRGSRSLGYESLRGSRSAPSFYDAPPTQQIPRKPVPSRAARALYQPASSSDYDSRLRGAGDIHPIAEADEDEGPFVTPDSISSNNTNDTDDTASDPFVTPTATTAPATVITFPPTARGSRTPSPELMRQTGQHPEVQDWVSDVDAADAVLTSRIQPHGTTTTTRSSGRFSPTRRASTRSKAGSQAAISVHGDDERTASNLSDSNRSAFSFVRSDSLTSAARLGIGAFSAAAAAAAVAANADGRLGSSSGSSASGHTFNTAKSSFPALQAEGPGLLLGRSGNNNRGSGYSEIPTGQSADEYYYDRDEPQLPPSPSKTKPRRPSRGFLGSLRRVFSGTNSGTEWPDSSRAESPAHASLNEVSSDYEPRLVGMGGMLLRRKQGREAWEAVGGDEKSMSATRGPGITGLGSGEGEDVEEDWDIERAVEQRLVQVMFTVPKERLRVVNADLEREEWGEIVDPEKDEAASLDLKDEEEQGEGETEAGDPQVPGVFIPQETLDSAQVTLRNEDPCRSGYDPRQERDTTEGDEPKIPVAPGPFFSAEHDDNDDDDGDDDGHFRPQSKSSSRHPFDDGIEDEPHDGLTATADWEPQQHRHRAAESPMPEPMTAEVVTLNRPTRMQPRVLEMVESFEQRSRSNSPEHKKAAAGAASPTMPS